MCLAILTDGNIATDNLRNGYESNPHSWGIGYATKSQEIVIQKALTGFQSFLSSFQQAVKDRRRKSDILVHFRIRTHGATNVENAHPFRIGDHTAMIHNGMLNAMPTKGDESDTAALSRVLTDIPEDLLYTQSVFDMLEALAGYGNKLAFVRRDGNAYIVNETLGHWDKGTWYSNRSYQPIVKKAVDIYYKAFKGATGAKDKIADIDWGIGGHVQYGADRWDEGADGWQTRWDPDTKTVTCKSIDSLTDDEYIKALASKGW